MVDDDETVRREKLRFESRTAMDQVQLGSAGGVAENYARGSGTDPAASATFAGFGRKPAKPNQQSVQAALTSLDNDADDLNLSAGRGRATLQGGRVSGPNDMPLTTRKKYGQLALKASPLRQLDQWS